MATFICHEHAQRFDAAGYRRTIRENSGQELTTEGIVEGFTTLIHELEARPDRPLDGLMISPFYIGPK